MIIFVQQQRSWLDKQHAFIFRVNTYLRICSAKKLFSIYGLMNQWMDAKKYLRNKAIAGAERQISDLRCAQ